MKKTVIFFTIFVTLFSFASAKEFADSEISIYNEVTAAFDTGFYPGAIEKANLLQNNYPDSVFLLPALIQKGEAQLYLKRYDQALETLETALVSMHTGSENFARCYFLIGKVCYITQQYDKALSSFYNACQISLSDKSTEFYNPSIFYSGNIYYLQKDFNKAIPLYEYVIKNGNFYSKNEYEEALQKLLICYNQAETPKKTIALTEKIPEASITPEIYWGLMLTKAESHQLLAENQTAYDIYTDIIEKAPANYGVIALKKAYLIASKIFGEVDGEDFAKSISAVATNPELEKEFWLRLGVDEYNQKNVEAALEYFDKAGDNGVAFLYKQKVAMDQHKNPAEIETELVEQAAAILGAAFENVNDSYYSLLLRSVAAQQKWGEVADIYNKIEAPDVVAAYEYCAAFYAQGQFQEVITFVEENTRFTEGSDLQEEKNLLKQLYASSLARNGNYTAANAVFKNLSLNQKALSPKAQLEYAKSLFRSGAYKSALEMAELSGKAGLPEGYYIGGLCCINLKRWNSAKSCFATYIKQQSNKSDFNKMALFYKGYAEYCQEEYKDSYATFLRYAMETVGSNYIRSAYEYAAKSALQLGEYKNAAAQAENVIKYSVTDDEKHAAVLFSAEIYTDQENYKQAVALLTPYTTKSGPFAVQALFQIAKIYVKQGDIAQADKTYTKVYTEFPGTELAEEAMYRDGEIFYSTEDYASAQSRLNKYIYKYVSGKFAESALFYCGDSCVRLGELETSIMMNKTLIQKYPNSIYVYGTYKNLMSAYYDSAEYGAALDCAKYLVQNFQSQAASDGVGTKLVQLEKIINGTDPQVAVTYSEFEKLGKLSTREGREAGTKLVQLYAKSQETKRDAFVLAGQLLELQKNPEELFSAAQNAQVIAEYNRSNNENKAAAEMYLLAAEYYRSSSQGESNAAAALYGAVEAFVALGLEADAKETAVLLVQLYPESKQAKNVKRLVK